MGHPVNHRRDRRSYLDAAAERSPSDCARRVTMRSGALYLDQNA